jgi:EmrB/QacA subfamily drug resistance transporter
MFGVHRLPCETPEAHRPCETVAASTRWVLPATILGSSMSFIDGSVVSVALPAMQSSLGASFGAMQWIANGYLLTLASLMLLGGASGDRLGRRRIFIVGLAGFMAASLACGLAPSASWLIAARIVQGAAAALLTPSSLAIIGAAFNGAARGPAIGTWAAAAALTTSLGPPLGGWLVDVLGWRSIFFINLPIGAVALVLAYLLPADGGTKQAEPLDYAGALLATVSLGALSYGLIALGEGASVRGAVAAIGAAPLIWLFIRRESRAPAPMMPLSLFRDSNFAGANALTVLLYAALGCAFFLLPFVLIQVHSYTATAAGAALLPFSVIMGLGSRWSGRLVERLSPRIPLIIGPAVTAIGFLVLGVSPGAASYWISFFPGMTLVGVGMTLAVAPLTTTVMDSAETMSGTASGINNAAARTGGLLAVAAIGLMFGDMGDAGAQSAGPGEAYRPVMFAAAVLSALSAVAAALTIDTRQHS